MAAQAAVKRAILALCCLACAWHGAQANGIAVRDDRGTTLSLGAPANRIISIAPHLTEIAFAAGVDDRLVAVSAFSDFPHEARRLPRVGDGARIDIERILTLKPDLVLAWKSGNQAADVARLERLGVPVWVSEASRLADIARLMRDVAVLAGEPAKGERAAAQFERELRNLRERYARPNGTHGVHGALRVFYEIWPQPLITVNRDHLISEVIALCGGANVFADVASLTPSVTLEAVLAARPQLILGGGSAQGQGDFAARWRAAPLPALRALPVGYVAPDLIQRASPRVIGGMQVICGHLDQAQATQKAPRR